MSKFVWNLLLILLVLLNIVCIVASTTIGSKNIINWFGLVAVLSALYMNNRF
jgi:hypothetical protein